MSPLNGNVTYTETPKQKENITNLTEKVKTTYIVAEIDKSHKSRNDNVIEKSNGNFTKHNAIQADSDLKKKIREKWPTDRAYFIAKELLMTERTFKKDLDVITTWFREELSPEDEVHLSPLLSLCEHLGTHHIGFLRDLEQRLSLWEGRSSTGTNGVHISAHQHHRIGDVILKIMAVLPIYEDYLDSHLMVLQKLDNAFWSDSRFQQMYRDFEHQKVCYLPFTSFVLKPLQRLLHYQILLDQLLEHYPDDHFDRADCLGARALLARVCQPIRDTLQMSENYAQLCELQRDLNVQPIILEATASLSLVQDDTRCVAIGILAPSPTTERRFAVTSGFEGLVQEGRQLIRQGCLLKHSTRGLQQRMFFLLSDILLYASKPPSPCQTFKVHGHVPLRALMLENGDSPNSFVIFGGTRSITVSANTEDEKQKWMTDIIAAVQNAKEHGDSKANYLSLKSCSSSEEVMDSCGAGDCPTAPKTPAQRSNTALHVCWHRAATISMAEIILQMENQLSGYLLRKFKNSAGWQKLWVVFTSFCLYFYKVYQDESPLASLPLLGYAVSPPSEQDSINKDFVFKLTFKNHVYFFRAESEHTYARWMEVIGSATQSPKCT